jgi:hypothetical protein
LNDLVAGEEVTAASAVAAEVEATYFNLGIVDIDADTRHDSAG